MAHQGSDLGSTEFGERAGAMATDLDSAGLGELLLLMEQGQDANDSLAVELGAVFSRDSGFSYQPDRVAGRRASFAERLTHEEPSEIYPGTTDVFDSFRITDGATTLLAYGKGFGHVAFVQRAPDEPNTYRLINISGWKEDPGTTAQHSLAEYRLHSTDDLRRTLDIVQVGDLIRAAREVPQDRGTDTGAASLTLVRHGELSEQTLFGLGVMNPSEFRELLQNGISLANASVDMLTSIGSLSARVRRLLGGMLVWRHLLGPDTQTRTI